MTNSPLDLAAFKQQLLALQAQITDVAEMVDNAAQAVELDQNKVGRLSRMDAMQGQAIAQASAERQQQMLQKIQTALARIERGDYGRCLECDQCIAIARLEIDPTAEYCISCANKLER